MCGKSQHHLGALCSHFFKILTTTFNINPFHWFTTHQNFHKTDKTFVFTFSKHFSEQNNKQHKKMPRKAMKCIVEVDLHVVSMAWSMYFSIYLLIKSGRLLILIRTYFFITWIAIRLCMVPMFYIVFVFFDNLSNVFDVNNVLINWKRNWTIFYHTIRLLF